jgi:hypothetical protein
MSSVVNDQELVRPVISLDVARNCGVEGMLSFLGAQVYF